MIGPDFYSEQDYDDDYYEICYCDSRRHLGWVMKQRHHEPTKLLLLPGEVSTHPTDPVEMRRLHYQTPGIIST